MRISDWSSDVCSSDLRVPSKLSKNRVSVGEFANGLHPAIDERLVLVGAISGQVACVEPCLMHALGAEMLLGRAPRRIVAAADRQIHILTALVERAAQRRPARRAGSDRKRVVFGKRVSVREHLCGSLSVRQKNTSCTQYV